MDRSNRLTDGASFALEAPPELPIIWGRGGGVGWAQGEALILVGPAGIGKTTLMQRLVLARIGVGPGRVLGFAVEQADRPVLYVAADRPRQASRSLQRMVNAGDRGRLAAMLKVWRGPLPFDIGADPGRLARWAKDQGAGTIAIDSLKDVALDLAKDEAGSRVARAIQETTAAGLELVVAHHQRKAQGENRKPTKIDDVYGSTWITAVAGSVVLLWGKAGDPLVELSHLKQPAGEIGPLRLVVDHDAGSVDLAEGTGPLGLLRAAAHGLTVREVASALFADGGDPDDNQERKALRKLKELLGSELAVRKEGTRGQGAIRLPDRYFATSPQGELH
jgi:replicative DNA helicase